MKALEKLNGIKVLNKIEQKKILGGAYVCFLNMDTGEEFCAKGYICINHYCIKS
jgi:hypothetical protein